MKTLKRELEQRYIFYTNRAESDMDIAKEKTPGTEAYARELAQAKYNRGRADAIGEIMEMLGFEVPDDF